MKKISKIKPLRRLLLVLLRTFLFNFIHWILLHYAIHLFNIPCLPNNWQISPMVPVFNNAEEKSVAWKNYHPKIILLLVKFLTSLQIIGLLITLRNVVFFLYPIRFQDFLLDCRFFWQTCLIKLTPLSICMVLLQLFILDILNTLDKILHLALLQKNALKNFCQVFMYIFSILRNRRQILLVSLSEFKEINFYSPLNYQKTYGFLMISRRIEVNNLLKCA